ncbi:hypothetical protein TNCV_4804301 [Trichonephila clavipes]|nr:hypothetical protein TNCV_4804301 [Trichonephila clavipes]
MATGSFVTQNYSRSQTRQTDHLTKTSAHALQHLRSRKLRWGCGSPVVKASDHGRNVMSSSPVPLKTRRVGQQCTLNLSRVETSSRWCDS